MSAIDLLKSEHRIIEQALGALENYANLLDQSNDPNLDDLRGFVAFIRQFADTRHHGKEEEILFRAMVDAGFPLETGPLAVMLREHEEGRRFVRIMAHACDCSSWSESDCRVVAESARDYAVLLRNHIWKEDNMLYVMAQQHMPSAVLDRIAAECTRFDATRDSSGEDAVLLEISKSLFEKYSAQK
jgi:hemerythrin-like domain-containing protein